MIAGDWKAQLREELERVGERAARDDINSWGGLATGGEERQQIIRQWLREKDAERESRERALFEVTQKAFSFTRKTYYAACAVGRNTRDRRHHITPLTVFRSCQPPPRRDS
jgi:hypothetical protein